VDLAVLVAGLAHSGRCGYHAQGRGHASRDVEMAAPLDDVLAPASGVPPERLPSALSALALACWTAHQVDERDEDEDEDGEQADGDADN